MFIFQFYIFNIFLYDIQKNLNEGNSVTRVGNYMEYFNIRLKISIIYINFYVFLCNTFMP